MDGAPLVREWQRRLDAHRRSSWRVFGVWHHSRSETTDGGRRRVVITACGVKLGDYAPLAGYEYGEPEPGDRPCGRCAQVARAREKRSGRNR